MAIQSINIEGPCCCRRSLLGHLGPTDQASLANASQFDFHWYYESPVRTRKSPFQHTSLASAMETSTRRPLCAFCAGLVIQQPLFDSLPKFTELWSEQPASNAVLTEWRETRIRVCTR